MITCETCYHKPSGDYCHVSQTLVHRRWLSCASYRKENYEDETREKDVQKPKARNSPWYGNLPEEGKRCSRENCKCVGKTACKKSAPLGEAESLSKVREVFLSLLRRREQFLFRMSAHEWLS